MARCTNILIGSSNIFVDAEGETTLDENTATDLGKTTEDGVSITREAEYKDIKADQTKGLIGKEFISETVKISCTLKNATLENLAYAYGVDPSEIASETLTINANRNTLYRSIFIKGLNAIDVTTGKYRQINIPIASIGEGAVEYKFMKNEEVGILFEATLIADCTTGDYFSYKNITPTT